MILLLDLIPPLDLVPMLLLVIAMLLALVLTLVRLLLLPVLVVGGRNWREEACVWRREGGAQRRRR